MNKRLKPGQKPSPLPIEESKAVVFWGTVFTMFAIVVCVWSVFAVTK